MSFVIKLMYNRADKGYGAKLVGFPLVSLDEKQIDYSIPNYHITEKYAVERLKKVVGNFVEIYLNEKDPTRVKRIPDGCIEIARKIKEVGIDNVFEKASREYDEDFPSLREGLLFFRIWRSSYGPLPKWYDIIPAGQIKSVRVLRKIYQSRVQITLMYFTEIDSTLDSGFEELESKFIPDRDGFSHFIVGSPELYKFGSRMEDDRSFIRVPAERLILYNKKYIRL